MAYFTLTSLTLGKSEKKENSNSAISHAHWLWIEERQIIKQCQFPNHHLILSSSFDLIWHISHWLHWLWENQKQEKFHQCHFTQPLTLNEIKENNQTVPIPKQPFYFVQHLWSYMAYFTLTSLTLGKSENKKISNNDISHSHWLWRKERKIIKQCQFPNHHSILPSSCDLIWHISNWLHWLQPEKKTKLKQCHFPQPLTLNLIK